MNKQPPLNSVEGAWWNPKKQSQKHTLFSFLPVYFQHYPERQLFVFYDRNLCWPPRQVSNDSFMRKLFFSCLWNCIVLCLIFTSLTLLLRLFVNTAVGTGGHKLNRIKAAKYASGKSMVIWFCSPKESVGRFLVKIKHFPFSQIGLFWIFSFFILSVMWSIQYLLSFSQAAVIRLVVQANGQ